MARHYVSVNHSSSFDPAGVTTGTSSSGQEIEISTLDGAALTKNDVLNALATFEAYFAKNNVPA